MQHPSAPSMPPPCIKCTRARAPGRRPDGRKFWLTCCRGCGLGRAHDVECDARDASVHDVQPPPSHAKADAEETAHVNHAASCASHQGAVSPETDCNVSGTAEHGMLMAGGGSSSDPVQLSSQVDGLHSTAARTSTPFIPLSIAHRATDTPPQSQRHGKRLRDDGDEDSDHTVRSPDGKLFKIVD